MLDFSVECNGAGGGANAFPAPNLNDSYEEIVLAENPLPCPTVLRQLLRYDAATGKLFWRVRPEWCFSGGTRPKNSAAIWNARRADKEAFTTVCGKGYLRGGVLGVDCFAHRVAWAILHGSWPTGEIDHIDHNKKNNRADNLRDVTGLENSHNCSRSIANKSGYTGVVWNAQADKWQANITVKGKQIYLGIYSHMEDAIKARAVAERNYGFHPNHGRSRL